MSAHVRERVLLRASDERDILRRKRAEQGRDQDPVTTATGVLSANLRYAPCSFNLAADPMPDDSGDFRSAELCETAALIYLGPAPLSARAAGHHGPQSAGLRGYVGPAERSRYLSTTATGTAVLLAVGAWSGVLTTQSGQRTSRSCWPSKLSSRRRLAACGSAVTPSSSPSAGSSCYCDTSGTQAAGEQVHMTTTRQHLPVITTVLRIS
jgi:hypothetical protein